MPPIHLCRGMKITKNGEKLIQLEWSDTPIVGVVKGWGLTSVLTLSQTSPGFYVSAVQDFGTLCGKRRNCS